jgi:preprotein translocase subunit SecG
MSGIEFFLGSLLIVLSITIIIIVLFQEGKQQSAGGIITGGGGGTFLSKNKSRSIDAFLARWTKTVAIMIFILVMLINAVTYFHWFGV